jgi:hypothetical protein
LLAKFNIIAQTVVSLNITDLANAAIIKFSGNLWYLGPEMVPLSLFSEKVTISEKIQLQKAMLKSTKIPVERLLKAKVDSKVIGKKLHNFINGTSINTLTLLGFDVDLLIKNHPGTWQESQAYQTMKLQVQALKVVNDPAERGIALMSKYNEDPRTKDEQEMQNMLQV